MPPFPNACGRPTQMTQAIEFTEIEAFRQRYLPEKGRTRICRDGLLDYFSG
jgi:hypothetical protein